MLCFKSLNLCSGNWQKLKLLVSYAKMIKNSFKQFRRTGAFFNNAAIILKLISPKKQTCCTIVRNIFFSRTNTFSFKTVCEVLIIKTPKRQQNAEIPPLAFIGIRLKIKNVLRSNLVVLHATEINYVQIMVMVMVYCFIWLSQ